MEKHIRETRISVDIEASGPVPGIYNMLALGACLVGDHSKNFYVEFKPLTMRHTKEAMAVNKMSLANLKKHGTASPMAMRQFARWVKEVSTSSAPVFVGFNAPFDWSFVNYYFHRFLRSNPFGHAALDIKSFFMGEYDVSWQETRWSYIVQEFGLEFNGRRHHAMDDAIAQAAVFEYILSDFSEP